MDPFVFLGGMFQMAGLFNLTAFLEQTCTIVPRDDLPQEGQEAFDKASALDANPVAYRYPEKGLVVVSRWDEEDMQRDDMMRLVCWAEIGEEEWGRFANGWWAENNPALSD